MKEDEKILKEAALVILGRFQEDIEKLEQKERTFMRAIQGILYQISISADEELNNSPENPFLSTYNFPATLTEIEKVMEEYNTLFHILSCIKMWSEYK